MALLETTGGKGAIVGTSSSDVIALLDGSQTVAAKSGNDIIIDFSDDKNNVSAGAGNDIVKDYVTQNLNTSNNYDGGSGFDTFMMMLTADQYNKIMSTTLLQDFANKVAHGEDDFNLSKYDAQLGFHLDVKLDDFEKIVLNKIAYGGVDNSKSIDEDHVLNITKVDLLANVVDDQYKEKIVLVPMQDFTTALGAHVTVNADGSVVYDPTNSSVLQAMNSGDSQVDSFTYQLEVRDPDNPNILISTTTATMNITVTGVTDNTPPVVEDINLNAQEFHVYQGTLQGHFSDAETPTSNLAVSLASGATNGEVILNADGTFFYIPNQDFVGVDGFQYTVSDGLLTSTASVELTVLPTTGLNVVNASGGFAAGTTGDDLIYGTTAGDTLRPLPGNDIVYGNSGNDTIFGSLGNDTLYGQLGADQISGEEGNDILIGGDGDDQLYGDSAPGLGSTNGNDIIFGGAGNDVIYGDNGTNITQIGGNDIIYGGDGNDTINLGLGSDIVYGNSGADTFTLRLFGVNGSVLDGMHTTIKDFNAAEDILQFTNVQTNLTNLFNVQIVGNDTVLQSKTNSSVIILENVQDLNILAHSQVFN